MATIRISQLTAVSQPTDDDVLIINDADTNTRKITFGNLTQGLLNTSATAQTKNGNLTIEGSLSVVGNLSSNGNLFYTDSVNKRIGIKTTTPSVDLDLNGVLRVQSSNLIQFSDSDNSAYIGLRAPTVVPNNFTFTLPPSPPNSTQLLTSTSGGELGFTTGIVATSGTLSLSQIELVNQGSTRFYESSNNGTNFVSINAPSNLNVTSSYILPPALPPSTGFILSCNNFGELDWVSASSGASGSNTQVQFATDGLLDSSANFVFNKLTNRLTVSNITTSSELTVLGSVQLGTNSTNSITVNGVFNTSLLPEGSTETLGSTFRYWSGLFVNTATVNTGLLPSATNTVDVGSLSNFWRTVFTNTVKLPGSRETTVNNINISSGSNSTVVLGTETSYKVLVQAKNNTSGDIEFFEQFITHDGSGVIQEVTGSNVQSPTPGNFLVSGVSQLTGGNIVFVITNNSVDTVNVKVHVLGM
jgi:hypothetical protein